VVAQFSHLVEDRPTEPGIRGRVVQTVPDSRSDLESLRTERRDV